MPGGWRDRELAARPALQLRAVGRPVPGRTRRRRNAAWHSAAAPACGFARASDADIALAAAGPRLDVGAGGAPSVPPRDLGGDGGIPGSAAGASPSRMRATAAAFSPAHSVVDVVLQVVSEAPLQVPVPPDVGGRPPVVLEAAEEESVPLGVAGGGSVFSGPLVEAFSVGAGPAPPCASSWTPVEGTLAKDVFLRRALRRLGLLPRHSLVCFCRRPHGLLGCRCIGSLSTRSATM